MTQKHTPAPWYIHTNNQGQEDGLIMGTEFGTTQVADTGLAFWSNPEKCLDSKICAEMTQQCLANAHLIAAAPELLEALKEALHGLKQSRHTFNLSENPQEWQNMIESLKQRQKIVEAAIAKAEGN